MKKLLLALLLGLPFLVSAQENTLEKETRTNDVKLEQLPYYSYGKGIGMTSPDSIFKLNLRFRMQNRITAYSNQDEKATFEGEIRRLRLRFDGYVGNPKFLYVVQLSFAPGDVGKSANGDPPKIIRDAAMTYRPNEHWNFIFGQTKLPGNRQRTNSSGALQLTDRSINNAKFNLDRDFGVQAYYLNEKKNDFGYIIKTAISTGHGRNWTGKESDSYALTGRVELYPFGKFTNGGAFFEGDLAREVKPKLMLASTFSHNNNAQASQGQLGNKLLEDKSFNALFFDGIFKYNGWAGMVSYMSRSLSDAISYEDRNDLTKDFAYVFAGHGLDYQMSYIFPSNYELIGRVSTQTMKKQLYEQLNLPNTTQFTLGATKYLWEHAFKIQAEFTYERQDIINNPIKNNWYFRMQFEMGI